MEGKAIILEMMKTTDKKIDIMEYIIEKMSGQPQEAQKRFVGQSKVFDRLDQLNIDFLADYQKLLKKEQVKEISALTAKYPEVLKDLKNLVTYAYELETSLDGLLKKL